MREKESDCATGEAQKHAVDLAQGLRSAPGRWTGLRLGPVRADPSAELDKPISIGVMSKKRPVYGDLTSI